MRYLHEYIQSLTVCGDLRHVEYIKQLDNQTHALPVIFAAIKALAAETEVMHTDMLLRYSKGTLPKALPEN